MMAVFAVLLAALLQQNVDAFSVRPHNAVNTIAGFASPRYLPNYRETCWRATTEENKATEASASTDDDDDDEDDLLEKAELLGKGAAKVRT
jgi:hypothetical protein